MKILITGASKGMGKGVAMALAGFSQVHEIILLCRSEESGWVTMKELQGFSKNAKISMVQCDLSKLADVKKVIGEIENQHHHLDGLFINAGIGYAKTRIETQDCMDSHFQVNYLSQFLFTLNLLSLLENSKKGGRVIFNVTEFGKIRWDDMQMTRKWSYEKAIHQAMAAKRMFMVQLHHFYSRNKHGNVSFIGFRVHKTVWTDQINIIPSGMKIMARLAKLFGAFISIETCGKVMAPLFLENREESLQRSGKLITWKKNRFEEMKQKYFTFSQPDLDRLWAGSLALCRDEKTLEVTNRLLPLKKQNSSKCNEKTP
ncbi:SDR family NAD(P)-dependent oxidoreductase [Negadavirga shengliensis]|uniref:SDR family NAD(P)-dependent oxidoreductase n=1 Tax=Negadavirga shengliensis TaxID=1389218 RepID=A0ABV9T906_9BACT